MPDESRDDLRRRINELEATVNGLTQEFVEATERIRHLEERADETEPAGSEEGEAMDESSDTQSESGSEDEEAEDDIIVA